MYQQVPRDGLPQWKFTRDRQHWVYAHAHDTSWPIKGCLNVCLAGPDSRLISPSCFWQAAKAPALYMDAAFKTTEKSGMVGWRSFHQAHFSLPSRVAFPIIGDGRYHHYVIRLAGQKTYRGPMAQLRIDLPNAGRRGTWVKIRSIGFIP